MVKPIIYSYKFGSQSAALLAERLNTKRIKHSGSSFRGRSNKIVINWGSSIIPDECWNCRDVLNPPALVGVAANKLSFFQNQTDESINHEISVPRLVPWTIARDEASAWSFDGYTVVARNSLTGHSGQGIIIVEPESEVPEAPLYTRYIKKDSEWRIHFMKFEDECRIIFRQRKIKDPHLEAPVTWKIRSHQNGFIFQHTNIEIPADVEEQARLSFQRSQLDFGAVDVIYNKYQEKAYVLEINSAPGILGETLEAYANGFMEVVNA